MNGFKTQRRNRNRRRAILNRRFYRGNYYFKQHREQTGYSKLVTNKNTLKTIINADIPIYVMGGSYSFSKTTVDTVAYADFMDGQEFAKYEKIYQQYRVIGVRFNIYRVGQPVLLTNGNVNHEWGLLGVRISVTQANQMPDDVKYSDNTFWVSYLGEWMTYSKFVSFKSTANNALIQWNSITNKTKQVYVSIDTKSDISVPNGYKIYLLSMQYMVEFTNPN